MVLDITYAKPKDLGLSLWDAGDGGKKKGGCDLWKMPIKY